MNVEGCAACGVPYREHCQRWHPDAGVHMWIAPSKELIRARMRTKYGLETR